jgi:hypothetical protein
MHLLIKIAAFRCLAEPQIYKEIKSSCHMINIFYIYIFSCNNFKSYLLLNQSESLLTLDRKLKGPKHEIFESRFFTEMRPLRIGDLGTGEKK